MRSNLVTGGCGFIGRHLVEQLVARGEHVRVLDLRPLATPVQGVEQVVGSITDPAAVARAMDGCERVFHLAANPNLWAPDPKSFEAINHQGTRHLAEAARKAGVGRFVFTSTGLVYGPNGGAVASEDDACAPVDASPLSKLAAERMLLALDGLDVRILRLPFV